MAVEVTEENLRHYYIELNTPLKLMPEIFGMSMGGVRHKMTELGIKKTQKQAVANAMSSKLEKDPDHFKKLNSDPEKIRKAQKLGVIARRANRIAKLASEGKSYDEVYKVFITDNTSIIKTGEHFGLNKGQMRSLLNFYGITKSPELVKECRDTGFAELYADEERVAEMVAKTRETSLARYGNNWYHNTASKEEMAVKAKIEEAFPNLEVVQGSYGIIRRPGSGGLMQLDFYFPKISLAVEYNGIYYHDKEVYLKDLENGTENSREALKDRLCREEGLELIHIWSDDWKADPNSSFDQLSERIIAAIESQLDLAA